MEGRLFHRFSSLSGDGRLDLDLGSARELHLRVLDAHTGEPVAKALATAAQKGERYESLHFVDGESFTGTMTSPEARVTLTDAAGEVKLRDLAPGRQRLTVFAEGYDLLRRHFEMPTEGRLELEVGLESGAGELGLPVLTFPDGRAAASAYLQALTPDGTPDPGCSRTTGAEGTIRIPEACLRPEAGRRFLVFHPEAVLDLLTSDQLRQSGTVPVARAEGLPTRLRLLDPAGNPLAGRPVSLRFPDLVLSPQSLTGARLYAGQRLSLQADSRGEIVLPHLNPLWPPPEVGLILAADPESLTSDRSQLADLTAVDRWFSLPPAEPGRPVELWLQP